MKNRLIFMICLVGCIWFTITVALPAVHAKSIHGVPSVHAKSVHGVPFLLLQKQINTLRHKIEELEKQERNVDEEVMVDCSAGDTIADVLLNAGPSGRLTITVEGTCVEDVTITRDDVTLQGGSGTVMGHIKIEGARRIEIEGLMLPVGIAAERGATAHVANCTIEVATGEAVAVSHGGFVELVGNPLILSHEGCAIFVTDGGEVRLQNNQMIQSIHGDPNVCASALGLYRGASARLRGGNTLVNGTPGGAVIDAADHSTIRQDGGFDIFDGGLSFTRSTNADIRSAQINGVVSVLDSSFVRLRNSNVNGLLEILGMSFLNLDRNVEANNGAAIALSSTLRMRDSTLNGDMFIDSRSQAYFDVGLGPATVNGKVKCGESIGSEPPDLVLFLHDSSFSQVRTSAGNPAFAYRGAAVGTPQGDVTYENCN
jgi:hypothetical protein